MLAFKSLISRSQSIQFQKLGIEWGTSGDGSVSWERESGIYSYICLTGDTEMERLNRAGKRWVKEGIRRKTIKTRAIWKLSVIEAF